MSIKAASCLLISFTFSIFPPYKKHHCWCFIFIILYKMKIIRNLVILNL
nr:MAG TPA: hypothetical protein [Caudoviricetes sp.]